MDEEYLRIATKREQEVLELRNLGLTRGEIADRLHCSTATVKIHTAHLISKGLTQRKPKRVKAAAAVETHE